VYTRSLCLDKNLHTNSQVTFIYIALFTIQIVSKQLQTDNMKIVHQKSKDLNVQFNSAVKSKLL